MSKLYIILGFKAGISGGQIYVYNKTKYLEKYGWKVTVIDPIDSQPIYIEYLQKFKKNIVKELNTKPYFLSKKQKNEVLNRLISLSGWNKEFDDVVVESNTIAFSLWGELLAKKLNAKHLALLIDAFFTDDMKYDHMDYLNFKLNRKELAGINVNSLKELFKGYRTLKEEEKYSLSFVCVNSVEDVEYKEQIDKNKYDYVIGSVGRLDKPFVPDMAKSVVDFANKYPDKKFLFLIVGGQASGDTTVITKFTDGITNLDVHITGLIYPIPRRLINVMDICIASSGSTYGSTKLGVKTICVTDTDVSPLGVRGYGLTKKPFKNNRVYFGKLTDLIEDVLFHQYCDKYIYEDTLDKVSENVEVYMKAHIDFMRLSQNESQLYFSTDKIKPKKFKHRIIFNLRKVMGNDKTEKILLFIKGLKNGRK